MTGTAAPRITSGSSPPPWRPPGSPPPRLSRTAGAPPVARYPHSAALSAPATANRHLAALRGVLNECWRLSLVYAER